MLLISLVDNSKKYGNKISNFLKFGWKSITQPSAAAGSSGRKSSVDLLQQQPSPAGRSTTALLTSQSPKARDGDSGASANGHGKKGKGLAKVHSSNGLTTPAAAAAADSADSDEATAPRVLRKSHYELGTAPRPRSHSFSSALLASDMTLPVPLAVEPGQSLPTSPQAPRKAASFEKHKKQHQHQQPSQPQLQKRISRTLTPASPSRQRPLSRKQSSSHSSSDSPATGCAHHKPESDSQPHANSPHMQSAPPPASTSASAHTAASAATPANEPAGEGGNEKQPSNDLVDEVLSSISKLSLRPPEAAPAQVHMDSGQRGVEQRAATSLEAQKPPECSLPNSNSTQQSTPEAVANTSGAKTSGTPAAASASAPAAASAPTPPSQESPDLEGSSTNL